MRCDTIESNVSLLKKLMWFTRNTDFMGATGAVHLDAQGDRMLGFDFVNVQQTEELQVFEVNGIDYGVPGYIMVTVGSTGAAAEYVPTDRPIRWAGGLSVTPQDSATVVQARAQISDTSFAVIMTFGGLLGVAALGTLAFTFKNRGLDIIKYSSPRMNMMASVEVLVCVLAVVMMGQGASSDEMCTAQFWVASIGFTLAYMPLFSKTYQVHSIFNRTSNTHITHKANNRQQLFGPLCFILLLDIIILSCWTVLSPIEARRKDLSRSSGNDELGQAVNYQHYSMVCTSAHYNLWVLLLVAAKGCMLLVGAMLAYLVRHVRLPALNDSQVHRLRDVQLPGDVRLRGARGADHVAAALCVFQPAGVRHAVLALRPAGADQRTQDVRHPERRAGYVDHGAANDALRQVHAPLPPRKPQEEGGLQLQPVRGHRRQGSGRAPDQASAARR